MVVLKRDPINAILLLQSQNYTESLRLELTEGFNIVDLPETPILALNGRHSLPIAGATPKRHAFYFFLAGDDAELVIGQGLEVLPGILNVVELSIGVGDAEDLLLGLEDRLDEPG